MKRTYALKRLLEHGPMPWGDLLDCTRWRLTTLDSALKSCLKAGVVRRRNIGRQRMYEAI